MADDIFDFENELKKRFEIGSREVAATIHDKGLEKKQEPKIAVAGCSDSRVPTDRLFDAKAGELFTFRNIGNSLDQPGNPNELSVDGRNFITYAHHIGVQGLVILPHGNCGCVANACKCAEAAPLSPTASVEAKILREMGDDKKFAVDAVKKIGAAVYLENHGLPAEATEEVALRKAVEIEHAVVQANLARKHLAKIESNMKVIIAHYDLNSKDVFMTSSKSDRFERVTFNAKGCGCGHCGCGS